MPTANNKCFFTGATDIEDIEDIHMKPIYDMPEEIPPPLPPRLYEDDEISSI